MKEQYVIVIGNPVDGIKLQGPFASQEDAIDFATEEPVVNDSWWITKLYSPSEEI